LHKKNAIIAADRVRIAFWPCLIAIRILSLLHERAYQEISKLKSTLLGVLLELKRFTSAREYNQKIPLSPEDTV